LVWFNLGATETRMEELPRQI